MRWLAHGVILLLALAGFVTPTKAALSPEDRQHYHDAFRAAVAGDWPAAWRQANQAQDPLLSKVLHWLDLSRGNSGAQFSDIADFLSSNPDWPGQLVLRQRAEEASFTVPDAVLEEWFSRFPPITTAGKLRQAEIWIAAGDTQRGMERIRDVWVKTDLTAFEEKTLLQRYHDVLTEADHVKRLDRLLWDGETEAARRLMPRVSADYRAAAEARMQLEAVKRHAERALAVVPQSRQYDPGLLYEVMHWRTRKGRYDEAIAILDHIKDMVYPGAWAPERQTLARYALTNGDISLAYRLASKHELTNGVAFSELEFLAGWIALRFSHQPEIAYNHFVRLYDQVKLPVSVARGAYWAGRAADAMGYRQLAAAWYGTAAERATTYYGQLAAAQLGDASLVGALTEPKPSSAEMAAFANQELVQVLHDLTEVGATDYMRPFLLRLSELATRPVEHWLIAHLAEELGRPDLAIAAAKKASYAGVTLLAEGYPLTDLPPGGSAEPPLVLAMTRQESAFDREAVSSAGARGLMQLMPATARLVAKALRLPFSRRRLTTDRHYNVTLGRTYLDGLLGDFSGSYVLAIAAYNAGPGRVRQWIRDYGDPRAKNVDVVDWIESIPVAETRNYVQRVLENLQLYRLRTGEQGLAFSLVSDLKR